MKLSPEQIESFGRDGYLLFPQLFTPEEVGVLRENLGEMLLRKGPETHRENEHDPFVKLVFALHTSDEPYKRLCLHPRLLEPVESLLGSKVHIIQSRINYKGGFSENQWTWHQDYNKWAVVDNMREPRALLVGVFIDACTPTNGPLMVIRGSHLFGHRPIPVQSVGLDNELITEMAQAGSVEALLGPPGSVVILDALTVHASCANITPATRSIFYVAYNSVLNTPINSPRDETRFSSDYTPLQAMSDDCLAQLVKTALV